MRFRPLTSPRFCLRARIFGRGHPTTTHNLNAVRLVRVDVLTELRERAQGTADRPVSRVRAIIIFSIWIATAALLIWMFLIRRMRRGAESALSFSLSSHQPRLDEIANSTESIVEPHRYPYRLSFLLCNVEFSPHPCSIMSGHVADQYILPGSESNRQRT
jgi:hypothetical protein